MKQIRAEELTQQLRDLLDASQDESVLVMRNGKPSALLLGVETQKEYDAEDWRYMTDPDFWRMIRDRRADQRVVPMEQVKARLRADEEKAPLTAVKSE